MSTQKFTVRVKKGDSEYSEIEASLPVDGVRAYLEEQGSDNANYASLLDYTIVEGFKTHIRKLAEGSGPKVEELLKGIGFEVVKAEHGLTNISAADIKKLKANPEALKQVLAQLNAEA